MSRPYGLILHNRPQFITRAVLQPDGVLLQTLRVEQEVPMTYGELATLAEAVLEQAGAGDPVLTTLAQREAEALIFDLDPHLTCTPTDGGAEKER